ncbi:putative von Willebrand factor, type A [Nautilia profundicola AmH]|uniref:von Willebrand factor, type A n=1 Tax=Nautilia profundicola (strain ATCC BAA-1463 / DSM 18972 / AmH) TaxID=598659 RepID=B9L895_NAUPA|nr:VWA domain-containing protein [Nautilia profundicola]ACM93132.1 putative von Willebrand factor, type A [Nautilia profundicola AmH]
MEFLNLYAFLAFLAIPVFFLVKSKNLPFSKEVAKKIVLKGKISKKIKFYLLIAGYVLFVLALARPIINNGYITIKAPVQNLVISLDISLEMDKKDLYPNRLEFAKTKIKTLLKLLNAQNTALILFDKNSYLISPPTKDYSSLAYLLDHTDVKDLKRTPTSDIENMIASAKNLVKNPKIVIFTSNPYIPKSNNIFVYFCSKQPLEGENIFNASYSNENLKQLAKLLNASKSKEIKIKDKTELFYYPLAMGILILFFVIFFPIRRIK